MAAVVSGYLAMVGVDGYECEGCCGSNCCSGCDVVAVVAEDVVVAAASSCSRCSGCDTYNGRADVAMVAKVAIVAVLENACLQHFLQSQNLRFLQSTLRFKWLH